MGKYLFLFIGGNIPESKFEQSVTDRLHWMKQLKDQGKFIDGSPLSPVGKVTVNQHSSKDYVHDQNSVNGFAIVSANDVQEAVTIAMDAPQVRVEYGNAHVEIRQLQQLVY
jgi:hypothetical protein